MRIWIAVNKQTRQCYKERWIKRMWPLCVGSIINYLSASFRTGIAWDCKTTEYILNEFATLAACLSIVNRVSMGCGTYLNGMTRTLLQNWLYFINNNRDQNIKRKNNTRLLFNDFKKEFVLPAYPEQLMMVLYEGILID